MIQNFNIPQLVASTVDVNAVRNFWTNTVGSEFLKENETIRMTYAVEDPSKTKIENGVEKKGFKNDQYLPQRPINSVERLFEAMNDVLVNKTTGGSGAGFSISSAVFKHDNDENLRAGGKNFLYKHSVVIDIDCTDSKGISRVALGTKNENTIYFNAYFAYAKLVNYFVDAGFTAFKPFGVYMTGGGYQFVMKWNQNLNPTQSEIAGNALKKIFKKELFDMYEFGNDYLANEISIFAGEVDSSFTDKTHTQRLCGTTNIKYGCNSIELEKFFDHEHFHTIIKNIQEFYTNSAQVDIKSKDWIDKWNLRLQAVRTYMGNLFSGNEINQIEDYDIWDSIGKVYKYESDNRSQAGKLNSADYDFLKQVKPSVIKDTLIELLGSRDAIKMDGTNHLTCACPFHNDNNASFAVYFNDGGVARMYDFHDVDEEAGEQKSYNFLEFYMLRLGKTKSEAMEEIAQKCDISLDKNFYKSLHQAETDVTIEELLEAVDKENYVYYRLANKANKAIIRNINTGETSAFDGCKMLTDHVLCNQLGRSTADSELKKTFFVKFDQFILVDAFEEFNPGQSTMYDRNTIKYVNLWVPSENYKRVGEIANTMEDMSIDEALGLIKSELPWMYIYLHQITQKGHLPFFINWLSNLSHYEVMPIIPVVTSVQGTGKNMFVDEVLNYYFNQNYVNVVDGKKLSNNFNSYMEDSSLIVIDEGDFSNTQEVDNIKYLSGNNKVMIEKKGVDTVSRDRHFNFLMYTNGLVPIRHPINERRFSYYRLDVNLETLVRELGTTIVEFMDHIRGEVAAFWAVIKKVNRVQKWNHQNLKDPQFFKQILLMHNFGILVTQVINGDWTDISLQLNEKVTDKPQLQANMELLELIKEQYKSHGYIQLTLINRYINSLEFKNKQSITDFIKNNFLQEYGITIVQEKDDMKIHINENKVKDLITMDNNLQEIIPEYFSRENELKEKQEQITNGLQPIKSSVNPGGPETIPSSITKEQPPVYKPEVTENEMNDSQVPIGVPPTMGKMESIYTAPGASSEVQINQAAERLSMLADPGAHELDGMGPTTITE